MPIQEDPGFISGLVNEIETLFKGHATAEPGEKPAPIIFSMPDKTVEPFIPPAGATAQPVEPGGPPSQVAPTNYSLFCTQVGAQSLLPQYTQAAVLLNLTLSISLVDAIASGSYSMYSKATDGASIWTVSGTATDSKGNVYTINDVAGQRLWGYVNPFVPGQPTYGDKNYKVEDIYVNGVEQKGQTNNVQVPGYGTLVLADGGAASLIWVAAS